MAVLKFTKRQWMTLIIIGLADFCNAICVSLQAPFFPQEAEKKGATATEYGLVFGIFELVVFLVSPLYGQYINRIGPKLLFNAGIFTTGISAIVFGLLDRLPGHGSFIALAFIVRIIEALGNAAFLTASFAIIAKEFPQNIATTFASLETFFGLGMIVGPMVGGALYSAGGYYLPFVVLGLTLFATAILTMCVLPRHLPETESLNRGSAKHALKIPGILVNAFAISATSASISFLSATLEPHLRDFNLSPIVLGAVFVINGGVYAIVAPFWGWLLDKFLNPKISSFLGSLFIIMGFCLIGPTSFLPLQKTLKTVILGLVCHGIGIASILIATFTDALRTAVRNGFSDNIETYGIISGIWTSTFALGAFVGPTVSGALYDSIGFAKSTIFIIIMHTVAALVVILYFIFEKPTGHNSYKELQPNESIISAHDGTYYSKDKSSSICSQTVVINNQNLSSEQPRPCGGMNSVLVCNSFSNKQSQWSSRDGTTCNLRTSAVSSNYGAINNNEVMPLLSGPTEVLINSFSLTDELKTNTPHIHEDRT